MPNLDFVGVAKKQTANKGGLDFVGAAKSGKSFRFTDDDRKKLIEYNKVVLSGKDGTVFGKVTRDAYKAIEGNTLDSYKPYDEEEKKIIDKYRLFTGAELVKDDGTSLGFVSQAGLKAIEENNTDNYTPINDAEKNTIDSYVKYATQKRREAIDNYKTTAKEKLVAIEKEKTEFGKEAAELRRERAVAKRSKGLISNDKWEIKDTRTGKEKREGKPITKSEGAKELEAVQYEYAQLDEKAEAMVDTIDKIDKYANKVYKGTGFFGQANASGVQGRLSQDTAEAYNDYILSPTEENRMRADALSALSENFNINNKDALTTDEDIGKVRETFRDWVAVSFASYLPQFIDQTKASVKGAAVGTVSGAAVGSALPGIGTATGAVYGARAGWVAGSTQQMFDTTRGMVFKSLIDAGYDEQTALEAAKDEAFISGIIEGAGEIVSMATLGTGKLVGKLAPKTATKVSKNILVNGVKTFAKKTGKTISENVYLKTATAVAGVFANAVGEYAEEYSQEAVSIANERRLKNGSTSLIGETFAVLRDQDEETSKRLRSAGTQGFKIGLMMGGVTKAGTTALEHNATAKTGKKIKEADIVQSVIDTGLKQPSKSQSNKLATKLNEKDKVSNYQIGKLAIANKSETVNIGDTYYDTKSKSYLKIVERDDNTTRIATVTPDGISVVKAFPNESADRLTVNNRYVIVDTAYETTVEQPTEATTIDTTPPAENTVVTETSPTEETTVTENTTIAEPVATEQTTPVTTVASAENSPTTSDASTSVYNILVGEKLTNKVIDNIINTTELREAFEQLSGLEIKGTKAEQRAIIRNFQKTVAEKTTTTNAPQSNSNVQVGDIFRNNKTSVLYTVVSRNETSTTVRNGLNSKLETMSNETADFVFNNTDTTKGDTFRKIQGATTTETENVSDTTDENIGVVVDAINETLKDGALDEIYASMEKHSLKKDITIFAESLSRLYKEHGTIGDMAYLFNDGGANVITAIESIMDTTRYSVADSKEMLQNQPESDIINSKKSKVSKSVGEKNGIEQSGNTIKNDERHSEMQAKGKSETVQNRGVDRQDSESSEIQLHRHGNKSVSGRIEQIEHRQLEQLVETVEFQNLSRNIGDMISTKLYNELSENKYANDSRLANDECDFSEVVTYDMLVDADNELRTLFADEIAEYFNQNNSADVDSTGMTVLKIVLAKLKNSIVRNEKGQLIPLYHATDKDFDKFEFGDIGYHFGSYSQAHQLASAKEILENARFIKAYLNITKPLVIEHDNNLWNATQIVRDLVDNGIIDEEQGAELIRSTKSTATKNTEIREILISKGYDGIIYKNEYESGYANSYIVFDDSQIIQAESAERTTKKAESKTEMPENEKNTTDKAENVKGEDGKSHGEGKQDSTDYKEPVDSMYDIPEGSEIVNYIVVDEHSKRLKRENPRAYSNIIRMARRLGMNVRFVKNLADEKGKVLEGLITSKGIFINADAKNPSRFVATHEFGHRMKQAAPKVWAKYQEYVINKLKRESFDSGRAAYDVLYEETKNAYGKDDADYIDEEIAVNYAGELFDSEEMLESFIREDKGLALRVRDWWYNVLESMGFLNEKKKAQQLWLKAYTAAAKNVAEGKAGAYSGEKFKYVGETDDGRKIYRTNYKEGTPKSVKQNDLIDIIQNIWSKKPIQLTIKENGIYKEISANFNPELSERSDLSKIVFGNRKGNGSEKRMTLDLSTDLYQIASDAKQTGSKAETGKDNKAHDGVKHWYYFITNLVYEDVNGKRIDCYMNIDVKENQYGHYFYSFAIEKGTAPQTLLAVVSDDMSPTVPTDTTISQDNPSVNSHSMQNTAENAQESKKSIAGTRLSEIVEKYGTIPKGEKPARDINVPKKIADDKPVSRFARTMMEAGVTPEFAISEFEKGVLDGTLTHEVITNKGASAYAEKRIRELGFEGALNRWTELAAESKVGKNQFALGIELYNQCVNNRDVKRAMKIAAELASEATRAGQVLQACRMLKQMNPDGQLYYLEKSIEKINDEFRERLGKKYKDIELDEKLLEEYLIADSDEARNSVYDRICQYIADRIPATKLDKWNSWRYLAMLGNPRTHIRNIAGNAVFVPAIRIKNYVGAVLERVGSIKIEERTKSILKDKKAIEFAKKDFAKMEKILKGVNAKYAITSDIEGKRRIFKTNWLEKWRLKNFEFLENEDMWFLKMHYIDSLARIITARKLDIESMDEKVLDTVRGYAIKAAQEATYRDANSLADGLNKFQRKAERGDDRVRRIEGVLLEGVMPFKKAPMNIAKQGVMYSPVGIMSTLYKKAKSLKNGELFDPVDFIDGLAKGLTGSGIILLGYFLAKMGMLSGGEDENEKKRDFDKMTGEQSYAIKAFGKSYTIDWVTPTSLPLFVGSTLYDISQGDTIGFREVAEALTKLPEPLLELSVFSGISNLFETAKYSGSVAVGAIVIDMATSYVLQALPTVGGQLSRIIDETKRNYYYADKTKDVPDGIQRMIGRAASKIPFASYLFEPSVDEWGRVDTYGGLAERGLENFVSPGYYSEEEYTAVDKEIKRLYEKTGESEVLPTEQRSHFVEEGIQYNMSATDYTETKIIRGQESFRLVKKLMASNKYKRMTDEEKVKAISKCYKEAGDYAKEKMLEKVKKASGK